MELADLGRSGGELGGVDATCVAQADGASLGDQDCSAVLVTIMERRT